MRLQQLDLNLFVVFDAIYRERNLTRAAATLNITQPAVSNALARLRQRLGDPLFVRAPKGVVPTPAADAMIEQVRGALALLETSIEATDSFDPLSSHKTLHFAMNDLAEFLLLGPLMKQINNTAPGIAITSCSLPRTEVVTELCSGQLDFAVDVPLLPMAELNHLALTRERYVCALRRGHPALSQAFDLQAYLALGHIHVSTRRSGAGHVDLGLSRLGAVRDIRLRVQHYMVAPAIVQQSELVWTVPLTVAQHFDLAVLELPFNLPALEWNLFWHKRNENSAPSRWLRRLLQQSLAK